MSIHFTEPVAQSRPGLVSVDGKEYPLRSVRLEGRGEGGIASSRITQSYSNPHDEALEVVYTMPLPADGAVLAYTIRVGEKVIRGEVQPREKAEKAYREAIYQGKTAGLLEQQRADTFVQRLGNVPPRTDVEVEIEVLQPLAFLAAADRAPAQWEYRFPTVVGVRYQGAPGRVPDADRLDADRDGDGGIPTRVHLQFNIAGIAGPGAGIGSPSHRIVTGADGEGTVASFADGERLDRDVVLRWNASTEQVGVRLAEGGGLEGDNGRYGLVSIVPPTAPATMFARDLTVLIDASGSMHGFPIETAKRLVADLVRSLEPGDRFELLAFANQVRKLTPRIVSADADSVREALKALEGLQASGGTEMASAMEKALESLRGDAQRQIVLLTDGYIGFESEVVSRIVKSLPAGCRVHAVGIGAAPNRTLTAGVARAGRGIELFVGDESGTAEAGLRLCAATARPVLTDVVVGGTAVQAVAPERPRDVFAGQPTVVTVELSEQGGLLELRGRLAGSEEPWTWQVKVPARGTESDIAKTSLPVGALHGRERIADLEAGLGADRWRGLVAERVETLGMRHRIASSRTSLVAIAETPSVDPRRPRRREKLAVEVPHGVSAEGTGLMGGGWATTGMLRIDAMPGDVAGALKESRMIYKRLSLVDLAERVQREASGAMPVPGPVVLRGTVIRVEGDLVVVEFGNPFDGLELPGARVWVSVDGGGAVEAEVVREKSSPRGPHADGVILRLVLRLKDGAVWPADKAVELRWNQGYPGRRGAAITVECNLRFILPAGAGDRPGS